MSDYLGPVPNIPTLGPVNIFPEDQYRLEDQIDWIYTDIAYCVNDKARSEDYLLQEDITNDNWVVTDPSTQDGQPIFRKTFATGVLAAGVNTIPHGITDFTTLVNHEITVTDGTTSRMLGYAHPTAANAASVDVNATNVVITLGAGFGAGYSGWITLRYTKGV